MEVRMIIKIDNIEVEEIIEVEEDIQETEKREVVNALIEIGRRYINIL